MLFRSDDARRLLQALVGKWGEEFGFRRFTRGVLTRIEDPADRACYLCPRDEWMPETLSHLLLHCPHPAMVRLRDSVRQALAAIILAANATPASGPWSGNSPKEFYAWSCNSATDAAQNGDITYLDLWYRNLAQADVQGLSELTSLCLGGNHLRSINQIGRAHV